MKLRIISKVASFILFLVIVDSNWWLGGIFFLYAIYNKDANKCDFCDNESTCGDGFGLQSCDDCKHVLYY